MQDLIWCVIPVHNNGNTILQVARECRRHLLHVVVIDDGSTDVEVASLFHNSDITVLTHARNKGKGCAMKTALRHLVAEGARFMLTIDGDGQHAPADIPAFFSFLKAAQTGIVIGARRFSETTVPEKSRIGRAVSNFWIHLETGILLKDSQSGFRLYPVDLVSRLHLTGTRYEFEVEVLVKAAWAGLSLIEVPVDVWYPPRNETRVSSFRPFIDNLRISLMHTKLIGRRILPIPHRHLVKKPRTGIMLFRHPWAFIRSLVKDNASPEGLAAAAAVGVFLATLPLIGFHSLVILVIATRLHLNRVMALAAQNLCMPPLVPFLCIEVGHYIRNGRWLTELSLQTVVHELGYRLYEWLIGALLLAPFLAALAGGSVFFLARLNRAWLGQQKKPAAPDDGQRRTHGRRRGNRLGFRFFEVCVRLFGLRAAYGPLYFVCPYYVLFDRTAVRGTMAYIRRRFPRQGTFRRLLAVYRLFLCQGRSLIDRHYVDAGIGTLDMDVRGYDRVAALIQHRREGFILLTAHVGNWQVAMNSLSRIPRRMYMLMRPEDNAAVKASLGIDRAGGQISIISPEGFMGGVVEITKAIQDGHIVSIMGDRHYGFNTVEVSFMNDRALFPESAFRIAAAVGCPVVVLLSARIAHRRYLVEFLELPCPQGGGKRAQVREWAQSFSDALGRYVEAHPYQFFLFQDVWQQKP